MQIIILLMIFLKMNEGTWPIINNYCLNNNNLSSLKTNYKKFDTIVQPINMLDLFCIKYEILYGCSNCSLPENKTKLYQPFIEVTLEDLENDIDLSKIINYKFLNYTSLCQKCSYNEEKKYNTKF